MTTTATATCFSSNSQRARRIYKIGVIVVVVFVWRCYFAIGRFTDDDSDGGSGGHKFVSLYFVKKAIIHFVYLLNISCASYNFTLLYTIHSSRAPHFLSIVFAYSLIFCTYSLVGERARVYVYALLLKFKRKCLFNIAGLRIFAPIHYIYYIYNSLVAIAIQIKDDTQRQNSIRIVYRSVMSAPVYACQCKCEIMWYITCVHFSKSMTCLFLTHSLCVCSHFETRTALSFISIKNNDNDVSVKERRRRRRKNKILNAQMSTSRIQLYTPFTHQSKFIRMNIEWTILSISNLFSLYFAGIGVCVCVRTRSLARSLARFTDWAYCIFLALFIDHCMQAICHCVLYILSHHTAIVFVYIYWLY